MINFKKSIFTYSGRKGSGMRLKASEDKLSYNEIATLQSLMPVLSGDIGSIFWKKWISYLDHQTVIQIRFHKRFFD